MYPFNFVMHNSIQDGLLGQNYVPSLITKLITVLGIARQEESCLGKSGLPKLHLHPKNLKLFTNTDISSALANCSHPVSLKAERGFGV